MNIILLTLLILHIKTCSLMDLSYLKCDNSLQEYFSIHPHLDAFWLNTFQQLTTQNFILPSFLKALHQQTSKVLYNVTFNLFLKQDLDFKYFTSQICFLQDWYEKLNQQKKIIFQNLLKNKKWEIVNGGFVQQDQGASYYDQIIQQYILGHQYLNKRFKYIPKVAWSTDSFGHSASNAAIIGQIGFKFFGFQRIDQNYLLNNNEQHPKLQFKWIPISDSNNLSYNQVISHVRHFNHRSTNFRQMKTKYDIQNFVHLAMSLKNIYQNNNFFNFIGDDFQEFNNNQIQQLDCVIKNINQRNCFQIKWKNPSQFIQHKLQINKNWPQHIYTHDFFPIWDRNHFWTGYFTTNPQLKKLIRDSAIFLYSFRKFIVLDKQLKKKYCNQIFIELNKLQRNVSISTHHDGITATGKYYVMQKLNNQIKNVVSSTKQLMKKIIIQKYNINQTLFDCELIQKNKCIVNKNVNSQYISILLINTGLTKKIKFYIQFEGKIIYKPIKPQYLIQTYASKQPYSIIVEVNVNAGNQFVLKLKKFNQTLSQSIQELKLNQNIKLNQFDININQNIIKIKKSQFQFNLSYVYSNSKMTNNKCQYYTLFGQKQTVYQRVNSGLYIMSNQGILHNLSNISKIQYQNQKIPKIWIQWKSKDQFHKSTLTFFENYVELQTFYFPNNQKKDIFIQIQSNIKSTNLYHDSNGYLVKKRIYNFRPTHKLKLLQNDQLNSNTYPMTSFLYMEDQLKKIFVQTNRAQGVTVTNKQGKFLINFERLGYFDNKGVNQQLYYRSNETYIHKIGFQQINEVNERKFQINRDQTMIGYISPTILSQNDSRFYWQNYQYLKFTINLIENDQILLRVQNMNDKKILSYILYIYKQDASTKQLGFYPLQFINIKQVNLVGTVILQRNQKLQKFQVLKPLEMKAYILDSKIIKINNNKKKCFYKSQKQ